MKCFTTARVVLFYWLLCVFGQVWSQQPRVSGLFEYQSPATGLYKSYAKTSLYIPMSDGVKLAADVFLPTKGPETNGFFPTVLYYTPYNRSFLFPKMGPLKKVVAMSIGFGSGPVFDMVDLDETNEKLLEQGYALVMVDMRGTGASFGSQMPLMPQLGADGKEVIDWITSQQWSNGDVGMRSLSYLAWGQFATAGQQPEGLRCIMPEVIGFDVYSDANFSGGITAKRWLKGFGRILRDDNRNLFDFKEFHLPATPVIDENNNGKLTDEWPKIDTTKLAEWSTGKMALNMSLSGSTYLQATLDHLNNLLVNELLDTNRNFFDSQPPHPYESLSYRQSGAGNFAPGIAAADIAIYHFGGWFDGFTRGTTKLYATLAQTNESRLLMTPRFHLGVPSKFGKAVGYDGKPSEQMQAETLRFMDRYLKGIPNGMDTEPPVTIFVMNKGWRTANSWPVPEQVVDTLFLSKENNLSFSPAEAGVENWKIDFTHASNYGKKNTNRWLMFRNGSKELLDRTALDPKTKFFDTPVLIQDLEVVGHPIINLYLSANQPNGDVFVYLCDVDEKGKSVYVTEGQLRAGWHELHPAQDQVTHDIPVLPDLPWHGYLKSEYDSAPFAAGKVVEMRFDLLPTAWNFKQGHKLRIAIAGADAGNFELPAICPEGKRDNCPETIYSLHHTSAYPSRLELPVIPAGK